MIGVEFEIVSPPELVDRVAALGERFLRAAALSEPGGRQDAVRARRLSPQETPEQRMILYTPLPDEDTPAKLAQLLGH